MDKYCVNGNGVIQQPALPQQPPSRKVSSPLPPLCNANDEIVEANSIPLNIGEGRKNMNLSETLGFRDLAPGPAAGPSGSTRTHLYSEIPSPNLLPKQRRKKERATQPCYLEQWR